MRLAGAVSEALRNIRSGTTRASVLALVFAAGVVGLASLDLVTVGALQRDSLTFDRAAASTKVVVGEGLIAGGDCDALAGTQGVRGAGALRPGRPLTLTSAPDDPVPTYAVSPGMERVLAVRAVGGTGAWLPTSLAELLGVQPGSVLPTQSGPLRVAGLFDHPEDGRDARLAYAILVPEAPATAFDECWASSWPSVRGLDEFLRWTAAVQPGAATPMPIGQLNNALGPIYDPRAAFDARVTRWNWVGAAGLGLLLGYVASRRRRLEYASALHAGQARPAQLLTALLEGLVWVGGGLCVAAVLCLVMALSTVAEQQALALFAAVPVLAAAGPMAMVGVLAGVLQTRERHLFEYFKDR